jgi:hypothetical protein
MALSTIPFSALSSDASNQGVNFRNLIINGDMSIAQRGTSFSLTSGNSKFPVDRFKVFTEGSFAYTVSQSTDVPTGQGFSNSIKVDVTTGTASPSASSQSILQTNLEGQMLQHLKKGTSSAESLTLSFWVKSTATGNMQVNLRDLDNGRIIANTFTVNSANTWEKKTLTFAGDTTGAFANDNGASLRIGWMLGSGSTYTSGAVPTSWEAFSSGDKNAGDTMNFSSSASNDFYITGVQLEVGTSASDFEFLPYDVNLLRCQRYLFIWNNEKQDQSPTLMGYGNGGSDMYNIQMPLPVNMRNNPSVSLDPGSGSARVYVNTSNGTGVDKNPFSFTTFGTQGNTARDGTCCLSFLINGFGGSLHSSGINSMYLRSTRMICDAEL